MKRYLTSLAGLLSLLGGLLTPVTVTLAQQPPLSLTSQRQPVRLSVQSSYQRYEDGGRSISAMSLPVAAFVPLGRHVGLDLRTSVVMAEQQSRLSGLNDVQVSLGYARRVGEGSLLFTLGVNVPVGKAKLSSEEFETATLLAQNVYDFRVPGLGQGLNVSPGLTWAVPVGEALMLGLGAAYQYRGGYEPRRGRGERYDPGDEVLLTGGLDYRLRPNVALSGDVTYTFYGNDTFGGDDFYEAGNKITTTLQLLSTQGFNEIRLLGRYRSRAKSSLPVGGGAVVTEEEQEIPDQITATGSYRLHFSDTVSLTAVARGHFFGETTRFSQQSVFEVGIVPEFGFSDDLHLRPQFVYTLGSFSGLEAGLALEMNL